MDDRSVIDRGRVSIALRTALCSPVLNPPVLLLLAICATDILMYVFDSYVFLSAAVQVVNASGPMIMNECPLAPQALICMAWPIGS